MENGLDEYKTVCENMHRKEKTKGNKLMGDSFSSNKRKFLFLSSIILKVSEQKSHTILKCITEGEACLISFSCLAHLAGCAN